jgi:glycerol-3-phosphate responsive antiterminator
VIPKAQTAKIDKCDYIKLNFCTVKKNISRVKRQHKEWKKIFVHIYLIRGQYSKHIRKYCNSIEKANSQILKMGKRPQ